MARVLADDFWLVGGAPVSPLGGWVVPTLLGTVGVLAGASVFDVPPVGTIVPRALVAVTTSRDTTRASVLPAVAAGVTTFGRLVVADGGVTAAGTIVRGGAAVLSGFTGAGEGVVTGCAVCLVVACITAFGMVAGATVDFAGVGTSVVTSAFTLTAGVTAGAGPTPVVDLMVSVTAATTVVVDTMETTPPALLGKVEGATVVLASISSASAQMLQRRMPEEGKTRQHCEQMVACR